MGSIFKVHSFLSWREDGIKIVSILFLELNIIEGLAVFQNFKGQRIEIIKYSKYMVKN